MRVYDIERRLSQGSVDLAVFSSAGFPPCALWDYALKLYSDTAVSEACLSLQDRLKLDVNLLLFCVWVAASGRDRLTEDELEKAMDISRDWQAAAVMPLRETRRYLKTPLGEIDSRLAGDLRRVVVESELYAEKLELLALDRIITRPATGSFEGEQCANDAAANLLDYLAAVSSKNVSARDREDLGVIWRQAFPGEDISVSPLGN